MTTRPTWAAIQDAGWGIPNRVVRLAYGMLRCEVGPRTDAACSGRLQTADRCQTSPPYARVTSHGLAFKSYGTSVHAHREKPAT